MRNYTIKNVELDFVYKLVGLANDNEIEVVEYTGSLIDNYIIYGAEKIKINNAKSRKFIVVKEVYLNEYSSSQEIILTDDKSIIEGYEEIFGMSYDEEVNQNIENALDELLMEAK